MPTLRDKAIQEHNGACYLFYRTYPYLKDPKILLEILRKTYKTLDFVLLALSKETTFVKRVHSLNLKQSNFFLHIKELVDLQKKSPVQFRRKSQFVICSKDYQLKVLSEKKIASYLKETKKILKVMDTILTERIKNKP